MCVVPSEFPSNVGGKRSLQAACAIATDADAQTDACAWIEDPTLEGAGNWARYFDRAQLKGDMIIGWDELITAGEDGEPVARVASQTLVSDRGIVWVFGHEGHEISELCAAFQDEGGRMTARRLRGLVDATNGTLHCAACTVADELVRRFVEKGRKA